MASTQDGTVQLDGGLPAERHLEALGLSADAEQAYVALLTRPDPDGVDEALRTELVRAGLLERGPDARLIVRSPQLVVEDWAQAQTRTIDAARHSAQHLAELVRASRSQKVTNYVELLAGITEAQAHFSLIQQVATRELLCFDRGPYFTAGMSEDQPATAQRGVQYRTVYDMAVLQDSVTRGEVLEAIRLGEEARMFPDIPLKMVIADRSRALIVLPKVDVTEPETVQDVDTLLVHPGPMLDILAGIFRSFWRLSVPVGAAPDTDTITSAEDARLLDLLSAGLPDKSLARELGVSERTVQRRIARLQELLGARNRFQLGFQAYRRRWI